MEGNAKARPMRTPKMDISNNRIKLDENDKTANSVDMDRNLGHEEQEENEMAKSMQAPLTRKFLGFGNAQ